MQIDFHHGITYIVARLAGFNEKEANIISYSAQYVDDATNSGTIKFRNGALYSRISSAHKMLDYRNFDELANHFVWIPFHFLPGNGGKKAGQNPQGTFVQKLVCTPDSFVAHDMMRACINDKNKDYGLHRLGICMHILEDTYSHQKFAGVNNEINRVDNLKEEDDEESWRERITDFFGSIGSRILSDRFPLGHGAALTYPDLPYLKWEYKNGLGKLIKRDNKKIFLDAVKCIFREMIKFKQGNPDYVVVETISDKDLDQIKKNIDHFTDEEPEKRYEKWIKSVLNGDFSFAGKGKETITYIPKGVDSWKHLALDTRKETETGNEKYIFRSDFFDSDWKLFHDALQVHRLELLRDILPNYGICAA